MLQNRLHWAGELVAGIEPPPGGERSHAELVSCARAARDATGDVRETLEHGGADAAWRLVHEWRGALFTVRLARHRLDLGPELPVQPPIRRRRSLGCRARDDARARRHRGVHCGRDRNALADLGVGLGLVAASFLVFDS